MNNTKAFCKLLNTSLIAAAISYSTVLASDKNSTDTQNINNNTNTSSYYIGIIGPLFDWKTLESNSSPTNNTLRHTIISDLNVSLAAGYQYNLNQNNRIKVDLELQNIFFRPNTGSHTIGDLSIREKLIINGYYNTDTPVKNLSISFGAGIGSTLNLLKSNQTIFTNTYNWLDNLGLTIQSTIGLEYKLTDNVSVSSKLKYFYDLSLPFAQTEHLFHSNQVAMGIQYTF